MNRYLFTALSLINFFIAQGAAYAQEWVTQEACDISAIQTDDPEFQKALSQTLTRTSTDGLINAVGKLWEVRHNDEKVSYLWGSLHSSEALYIDQAEVLLPIMQEVEAAFFEHTFHGMRRKDLIKFNNRSIWNNVLTASHWLQKLHPDIKKAVVERFMYWGIDQQRLTYLQATAAVDYLLASPCEDFNRGTYPIQDNYIQMLADHQNLEILGLEEPGALHKRNYGFWNNKTAISIFSMLGASLVDPELDSRDIAIAGRVYGDLYRRGEIGLMMQWSQEQVTEVLGEEEGAHHLEVADNYLLNERNRNWLKRLLPALNQQSNLIVVGAFHLPGKTGLIELLRREGMTVNRIILTDEAASH